MDGIFRDLSYAFVFLDDILVASVDESQHRQHLDEVFHRLALHGVTINSAKCHFAQPSVQYLGFMVSSAGISPLSSKVQGITDFPKPTDKGQLRRFLGMLNFYRRCLPKAAETQQILNRLIGNVKKKDNTPVTWTEEATLAFEHCKESIKAAALLAHPNVKAELSISCDASSTSIGAVLQQREEGSWKPLGFFSKALTPAQRNYSTYDRELVAIHRAVRHFRPYLEGRNFIIFTDHKPLIHAFTQKPETVTPMRIRLVNFISQFTTDIRYVAGTDNIVADTLSRIETITAPELQSKLAEVQATDTSIADLMQNPKLQLKWINLPGSDLPLLCEVSTDKARPYVPAILRQEVFNLVHNLSHPGVRGTRRIIVQRYFWPSMKSDVAQWARTCVPCQRAKVHRHTVSPPVSFAPTGRFEHLHVDIVGPLPTSHGMRYLLTMIDRYTRWPEVHPLDEITAENVASALYNTWVARFGVPRTITSDQGRQFESHIFRGLEKHLGIKHARTTAYHPQSNGCIERWHRSLKVALKAQLNSNAWIEHLPSVLLGLRAALRDDNVASAAEMVYGQPLRLPGEFIEEPKKPIDAEPFLITLRTKIQSLRPAEHRSSQATTFIPRTLLTSSHVFLRDDSTNKPLTPPYSGPHRVMERSSKTYTIQLPTGPKTVSIDRLKPAYLLTQPEYDPTTTPTASLPETRHNFSSNSNDPDTAAHPATPVAQTTPQASYTTQCGRKVKRPVRYCDSVIGGSTVAE